MKSKIPLYILLVSFFASCASVSPPSQLEIQGVLNDAGEQPDNYQDILKSMWNDRLIDPYSAKYEFGNPEHGWIKNRSTSHQIRGAWIVIYSVNAKNKLGGYTGKEKHIVFFNNGRIIEETYYNLARDAFNTKWGYFY